MVGTPTPRFRSARLVVPLYVRMPSCVAVVPPFSPIVKSAPLRLRLDIDAVLHGVDLSLEVQAGAVDQVGQVFDSFRLANIERDAFAAVGEDNSVRLVERLTAAAARSPN